jgi:hypothetical protein
MLIRVLRFPLKADWAAESIEHATERELIVQNGKRETRNGKRIKGNLCLHSAFIPFTIIYSAGVMPQRFFILQS